MKKKLLRPVKYETAMLTWLLWLLVGNMFFLPMIADKLDTILSYPTAVVLIGILAYTIIMSYPALRVGKQNK